MIKLIIYLNIIVLSGCFLSKKELKTNHHLENSNDLSATSNELKTSKENSKKINFGNFKLEIPEYWRVTEQEEKHIKIDNGTSVNNSGPVSELQIDYKMSESNFNWKNIFLISSAIRSLRCESYEDRAFFEITPKFIALHINDPVREKLTGIRKRVAIYFFENFMIKISYNGFYLSHGLTDIISIINKFISTSAIQDTPDNIQTYSYQSLEHPPHFYIGTNEPKESINDIFPKFRQRNEYLDKYQICQYIIERDFEEYLKVMGLGRIQLSSLLDLDFSLLEYLQTNINIYQNGDQSTTDLIHENCYPFIRSENSSKLYLNTEVENPEIKNFIGHDKSESFVFKISGEESILARFLSPLQYYIPPIIRENISSLALNNPVRVSFNDLSQLEMEINGKVDEAQNYDENLMQFIATLNEKKSGLIKTFCSKQRKIITALPNTNSRDKIIFVFSPCHANTNSNKLQIDDKNSNWELVNLSLRTISFGLQDLSHVSNENFKFLGFQGFEQLFVPVPLPLSNATKANSTNP